MSLAWIWGPCKSETSEPHLTARKWWVLVGDVILFQVSSGKLTWQWKITLLKMYSLLKCRFSIAMLVYRRVKYASLPKNTIVYWLNRNSCLTRVVDIPPISTLQYQYPLLLLLLLLPFVFLGLSLKRQSRQWSWNNNLLLSSEVHVFAFSFWRRRRFFSWLIINLWRFVGWVIRGHWWVIAVATVTPHWDTQGDSHLFEEGKVVLATGCWQHSSRHRVFQYVSILLEKSWYAKHSQ